MNFPVAQSLKLRVAVDRNKRDGYMRNRSGIGPDHNNDVNYFAARFSVLAEISPLLENYTIASYSNSFSNGFAQRIAICERDPDRRARGQILTAQAACDQIDRQSARADGSLGVDINKPDPYLDIEQWQAINTTTWYPTDTLTVKNIVSYSELREQSSYSLYGDNFTVTAPFPSAGSSFKYIDINGSPNGYSAAQKTFSNELQIQGSDLGGTLDWQAGAYVERSRPIGSSNLQTAVLLNCSDFAERECVNPMGAGFISDTLTQHKFDTTGFYAQSSFALSDKVSVTGGIRYTIDKTTAIGQSTRITPATTSTPLVRVCDDTLDL